MLDLLALVDCCEEEVEGLKCVCFRVDTEYVAFISEFEHFTADFDCIECRYLVVRSRGSLLKKLNNSIDQGPFCCILHYDYANNELFERLSLAFIISTEGQIPDKLQG